MLFLSVALPWTTYAEWMACRLTCRAVNAAALRTPEERRLAHHQPRLLLAALLTRAGIDQPERVLAALRAHPGHFLGGSAVLWALTQPSAAAAVAADDSGDGAHWLPADLDFFGLAEETPDLVPSVRDQQHLTPFLRDAFGCTRPFYSDADFAALEPAQCELLERGHQSAVWSRATGCWQPITADEAAAQGPGHPYWWNETIETRWPLECIGHRDHYAALPILARKYRLRPGDANVDYLLVRRGLSSRAVEALLTPLLGHVPSLARLVASYAPVGYASVPDFLACTLDLPLTSSLFDGARFWVRDWEALWTGRCDARVVLEPVCADETNDNWPSRLAQQQTLWLRALDRVDKYRARGYDVRLDAGQFDSRPLWTPAYPPSFPRGAFHGTRGQDRGRGRHRGAVRATHDLRRHSASGIRGAVSPTLFGFAHVRGVLEPPMRGGLLGQLTAVCRPGWRRGLNLRSWRPTRRLLPQLATRRAPDTSNGGATDESDDEATTAIQMSAWRCPCPSAPVTPRGYRVESDAFDLARAHADAFPLRNPMQGGWVPRATDWE